MAINRYDQPAQAEFMNTYVPIPFDEMMKVGAMKQAAVEEGDKLANETLASLSTFQVAPFDEKNYLTLRKDYENKLSELYNTTGGPGTYEFKKGVNNLRTAMGMDPVLRGMQYNLGQYQDFVKQKQEATTDNATPANTKEIDDSYRRITEAGGTVGLLKSTGVGKWTPGNWYKNVNVDEEIETYVDDVAESSLKKEGFTQDANGSFIVGQMQAGKTLNALGAPFGVVYNETKDPITGKKVLKMEMTDSGNRIMYDFFQKPAGRQLLRDAEQEAADKGLPEDQIANLAAEKYFSKIGSKINERVSTKGEYTIEYDPKWLADYNRAQDDKQTPLTIYAAMGIPGSDLKSQKDVFKAEAGFKQSLAAVDTKEAQYKNRRDVQEVLNGTRTNMVDDEGKEVSLVLKEYEAERAQIKRDQADLNEKMYRVRKEADIPEDWQVESEILNGDKDSKGRQKYYTSYFNANKQINRIDQLKEEATIYANRLYGTGASSDEHKQAFEDKYEELLMKESGTYKKINEILKRDAAASSQVVGITNLPTKSLDTYLSDKFIAWAAPGGTKENRIGGGAIRLQNFRTGEDFTDRDYAKISGEKAPVVAGLTYSPTDKSLKVVYRTYDKKGALNEDLVTADAPEGLVDMLIKEGYTNEVTVALNQQVPAIENSRSKTGTIGLNGIEIEVHQLTPTEKENAGAGVNYYITPKGSKFTKTETGPDGKPINVNQDLPTTYTASSMGEILNWFIKDIYIPNSPKTEYNKGE